jgi:predicted ATPase
LWAGPVREVAALLDRSRLVTATGPGGAGKTRLAGQVAGRVAGRFADGVWLAELAPVRDPALVPAVVAAALGIPERPGMSAAGVLARVLARQQLLLVLDNCEHVIGAAAQLCAGLLAACDDVRVLATSREPLRVAGEARYRLGPLSLPDLNDAGNATRSEAVALFTDRARHADPRFALDDQIGRASASSAPGNGSWSPWSPRAAPTLKSPPSCTSASAPSAPTWTGSGTRPAAGAAPT